MDGRRFLVWFAGAAALIAAGIFAALIAIDPFDRGHGLIRKAGTLESGPRTANVSRGRNPEFNAALIGNSHIQLISPERLDGLTNLRWVQLTIPATTPREQLPVLEWFRLNHPGTARAIIIGADYFWCHHDPEFKSRYPFPFWLYEPRTLDYLAGLFRMQAARVLPRRIAWLAGRGRAQRADGYWDYEAYRTRDEAHLRREIAQLKATTFWNETGRFPWIERLGLELARLPANIAVILLAPPVHPDALPAPGTAQATGERSCVAALQRIADARPGTILVDIRKDSVRYGDPAFFWDASHYSRAVAEDIEAAVAAALKRR